MRPQIPEELKGNGFLVRLYGNESQISRNPILAYPYTAMQENLQKLGIKSISELQKGVDKTIDYAKQWLRGEDAPISYSLVKQILCENLGLKEGALDSFEGNIPVLEYVNKQLVKCTTLERTMDPLYLKTRENRVKPQKN